MSVPRVLSIAGTDPTTVGEPYEDASGTKYLPMFRQPGLVYAATGDDLRRAYERAISRGVGSVMSNPTSWLAPVKPVLT